MNDGERMMRHEDRIDPWWGGGGERETMGSLADQGTLCGQGGGPVHPEGRGGIEIHRFPAPREVRG